MSGRRLYNLKRDRRSGLEKPDRPALLLTSLNLLKESLMPFRTHQTVLTNSANRTTILRIIPLSSLGERAQDRLERGGPCLFLDPA